MKHTYRSGWGRTSAGQVTTQSAFDFLDPNINRGTSGLAAGEGRSYGDSSLNLEGITWETKALKSIWIDPLTKLARCGAGVTFAELEEKAIRMKLFPKVVPGTAFVTMGGAVASNIHGKSHQGNGSFGDNTKNITLIDSNQIEHFLEPDGQNSELFWATVGGMGLTGLITEVTIQLMDIESDHVETNEVRVGSIQEALKAIRKFDEKYHFTVAWLDFSGDFKGRGKVSGANIASLSSSDIVSKKNKFLPRFNISVPDLFPNRFINNFTVRIFNLIWFAKPLQNGLVEIRKYLHPLDSVSNWNRVYGKTGFIQYQFVVPLEHEWFLEEFLIKMKSVKGSSFLSVLKKFGKTDSKFLSFPIEGWTLAIDVNYENNEFRSILAEIDKEIIKIGGRIYLTKDSCLSKESFLQMYPEIHIWKDIKTNMDPDNYWKSQQGERLGLC